MRMKATYREASTPGHGHIVFSQDIFPDKPWSLGIRRSLDHFYLAGGGKWVAEEYYSPVDGQVMPDGSLEIAAGPNIVDSLDPREVYQLILKGDGESQKARLNITSINYTPGGSGDYTAQNAAPLSAPPPPPSPPSPSPPSPPPAPERPAPPQPEAGSELEMTPPPPTRPERSGKWWKIALLLVLIGLCFAWYFLDPRKEGGAGPAPALSAEEQVRQFFKKEKNSPAEAMELAAKLPKTERADQDAVYRLWYFAATNGEPTALISYGETLDPSRPSFGSIEKNAPEAWRMYEKAIESNPALAHQEMEKMRQWLTTEAAKGNRQAREWLLEIDQPR